MSSSQANDCVGSYRANFASLLALLDLDPDGFGFLDCCPGWAIDGLYEAFVGPLAYLDGKAKMKLVLEVGQMVRNAAISSFGADWHFAPSSDVFSTFESALDFVVDKYLVRRSKRKVKSSTCVDCKVDVPCDVEDFVLPQGLGCKVAVVKPYGKRVDKSVVRERGNFQRFSRARKAYIYDVLSNVLVAAPVVIVESSSDTRVDFVEILGRVNKKKLRYIKYGRILEKKRWFVEQCYVLPQSGMSTRLERDVHQVKVAKEKAKQERKKESKRARLDGVKASRDKRSPILESQGLGLVPGVCGVVLTAAFANVLFSVRKLVYKADNSVSSANGFISQFAAIKAGLTSNLGKVLWSLPLTITVLWAIGSKWCQQSFIKKTLISALISVLGPKLWGAIGNVFPEPDCDDISGVHTQSIGVNNFSKLIVSTLTFGLLGDKFMGVKVNDLVRRFSLVNGAVDGFSKLTEWACDFIEVVVNYFRKLVGKDEIELRAKRNKEFLQWASEVDAAALAVNSCKKDVSPADLNSYVDLMARGAVFKELYRATPQIAIQVDKYMAIAYGLVAPNQGALSARNNFRIEPEFVLLSGAPGIGKTIVTLPMTGAILKLSGLLPEDCGAELIQANVWQKSSSPYWNGYACQLGLIMDDFGQARPDATDKENDYMQLIKLVSNWACPLNFADLPSKGKIYFNSPLIMGTTNLPSITSPASVCLFDTGAVLRRIKHPYVLELEDEFKQAGTQFLDVSKFDAELLKCKSSVGMDGFPWYIWNVRKHNFDTGVTSAISMPLRHLVMEVANSIKSKVRRQSTAQSDYNHFFDGLMRTDSVNIAPQGGINVDEVKKKTVSELKAIFLKEDKTYSALGKTLRACVLGFAIGFSLRIAFSLVAKLFSLLFPGFGDKESKSPSGGFIASQSNRPATKGVRVSRPKVKPQSVSLDAANNLYANSYKVVVKLSDTNELYTVGQILFLCSTLAVMPEHYMSEVLPSLKADFGLSDDDNLQFINSVKPEYNFTKTIGDFANCKKLAHCAADVVFVEMGTNRAHRSVLGSMMSENHMRFVGGMDVRLDLHNMNKSRGPTRMFFGSEARVVRNMHYNGRKLERGISYRADTVRGDCGAILSVVNNSHFMGQTFIGLHIAGDSRGTGYSSIISREMADFAIDKLSVIKDEFIRDCAAQGLGLIMSDELPKGYGGSFLPIGKVGKKPVICPRSGLYKTCLYGSFGPYEYYPAKMAPYLCDGEVVFPMANAVKPYSSPVLSYDKEMVRKATHVAMGPFDAATKNHTRTLFTFEEAIKGIVPAKFRSIPRGTSAGYPYVTEVSGGKKEFFGDLEVYDLTNDKCKRLYDDVCRLEENAKLGIRGAHIFLDFMKDELRSKAKVESGATRLISSSPLRYTVLWRMYFGAFTSAAMLKNIHTGMAPGMCTYTDAERLTSWLQKKGLKVFGGDFKGFDASQQCDVFDSILDFVNRWYNDGPENALVRRVLWEDLCHSRHVGGLGFDQCYIYQWNKCLPSGHPFTTICNSMYSLILLVACYGKLTGDVSHFWRDVCAVTYGDDNVCNIADNIKEVFNQVTVSRCMEEVFGLVYTSDKKDGNLVAFCDIEDVTFLKRSFRFEEGQVMMALELQSFLYTVYWCKNKKLEKDIRFSVLDNALQELSLCDPVLWDEHAQQVNDELVVLLDSEYARSAPFTRRDYQKMVQSRSDSWF